MKAQEIIHLIFVIMVAYIVSHFVMKYW